MKQLKWLCAAALALSAGLIAILVRGAGRVQPLWLAIALTAALLAIAALAFSQARLQRFLLAENRRLKEIPKWSDDDVKRLEELHRQSELSALQYQINPHFLYNTLDTIRAQALIDDELDIAQMAEKLARFFRYSISNRETIVRVEEEIHHIEDYIFIQKKRFGDRFDLVVDLESPEISEYYMLKLMLQPLVENAIVHGLERLKQNGLVSISISATQGKLLICVEDNGIGMTEDRLNELNEQMRSGRMQLPERTLRGHGIAAQNVNSRIKLLFGEDYGMHYRSEPNQGTKVTVTMPLVDDFERSKYEEIKL